MFEKYLKIEYYKVELDYSDGSAYDIYPERKLKTIIKFGRLHNGGYEKSKLVGRFTYDNLRNILFLLKRGYELPDLKEYIQNLNDNKKESLDMNKIKPEDLVESLKY